MQVDLIRNIFNYNSFQEIPEAMVRQFSFPLNIDCKMKVLTFLCQQSDTGSYHYDEGRGIFYQDSLRSNYESLRIL